jgi:hypothetical protein
VKVTQELSRHSTPVLTLGRYTHARMSQRTELKAPVAFLASVVWLLLTPPLTPERDTAGTTKRRRAA